MKSRAVGRFWRLYDGLPAEIRRAADKQFVLWLNNVVKAPAVGVITVSKWPAAFLEGHTSGPCPSLFLAARVQP